MQSFRQHRHHTVSAVPFGLIVVLLLTLPLCSAGNPPTFSLTRINLIVHEDAAEPAAECNPATLVCTFNNFLTGISSGLPAIGDDEAQSIGIEVVVGESALFSVAPHIKLSGTVGTLSFGLRDNANTNGEALQATVVVSDSGNDGPTQRNFWITVVAVNDPPIVGMITTTSTALEEDSPGANLPPVIINVLPGPSTAYDESSQTLSGACEATDKSFFVPHEPLVGLNIANGRGSLDFTLKKNVEGKTTLRCVVFDSLGKVCDGVNCPFEIALRVIGRNDPPVIEFGPRIPRDGKGGVYVEVSPFEVETFDEFLTAVLPAEPDDAFEVGQEVKDPIPCFAVPNVFESVSITTSGTLTISPDTSTVLSSSANVTCTATDTGTPPASSQFSFEIKVSNSTEIHALSFDVFPQPPPRYVIGEGEGDTVFTISLKNPSPVPVEVTPSASGLVFTPHIISFSRYQQFANFKIEGIAAGRFEVAWGVTEHVSLVPPSFWVVVEDRLTVVDQNRTIVTNVTERIRVELSSGVPQETTMVCAGPPGLTLGSVLFAAGARTAEIPVTAVLGDAGEGMLQIDCTFAEEAGIAVPGPIFVRVVHPFTFTPSAPILAAQEGTASANLTISINRVPSTRVYLSIYASKRDCVQFSPTTLQFVAPVVSHEVSVSGFCHGDFAIQYELDGESVREFSLPANGPNAVRVQEREWGLRIETPLASQAFHGVNLPEIRVALFGPSAILADTDFAPSIEFLCADGAKVENGVQPVVNGVAVFTEVHFVTHTPASVQVSFVVRSPKYSSDGVSVDAGTIEVMATPFASLRSIGVTTLHGAVRPNEPFTLTMQILSSDGTPSNLTAFFPDTEKWRVVIGMEGGGGGGGEQSYAPNSAAGLANGLLSYYYSIVPQNRTTSLVLRVSLSTNPGIFFEELITLLADPPCRVDAVKCNCTGALDGSPCIDGSPFSAKETCVNDACVGTTLTSIATDPTSVTTFSAFSISIFGSRLAVDGNDELWVTENGCDQPAWPGLSRRTADPTGSHNSGSVRTFGPFNTSVHTQGEVLKVCYDVDGAGPAHSVQIEENTPKHFFTISAAVPEVLNLTESELCTSSSSLWSCKNGAILRLRGNYFASKAEQNTVIFEPKEGEENAEHPGCIAIAVSEGFDVLSCRLSVPPGAVGEWRVRVEVEQMSTGFVLLTVHPDPPIISSISSLTCGVLLEVDTASILQDCRPGVLRINGTHFAPFSADQNRVLFQRHYTPRGGSLTAPTGSEAPTCHIINATESFILCAFTAPPATLGTWEVVVWVGAQRSSSSAVHVVELVEPFPEIAGISCGGVGGENTLYIDDCNAGRNSRMVTVYGSGYNRVSPEENRMVFKNTQSGFTVDIFCRAVSRVAISTSVLMCEIEVPMGSQGTYEVFVDVSGKLSRMPANSSVYPTLTITNPTPEVFAVYSETCLTGSGSLSLAGCSVGTLILEGTNFDYTTPPANVVTFIGGVAPNGEPTCRVTEVSNGVDAVRNMSCSLEVTPETTGIWRVEVNTGNGIASHSDIFVELRAAPPIISLIALDSCTGGTSPDLLGCDDGVLSIIGRNFGANNVVHFSGTSEPPSCTPVVREQSYLLTCPLRVAAGAEGKWGVSLVSGGLRSGEEVSVSLSLAAPEIFDVYGAAVRRAKATPAERCNDASEAPSSSPAGISAGRTPRSSCILPTLLGHHPPALSRRFQHIKSAVSSSQHQKARAPGGSPFLRTTFPQDGMRRRRFRS